MGRRRAAAKAKAYPTGLVLREPDLVTFKRKDELQWMPVTDQ